MHDLYLEALLSNDVLITPYRHSLGKITGDAIAELDAFLAKVDGKMQ